MADANKKKMSIGELLICVISSVFAVIVSLLFSHFDFTIFTTFVFWFFTILAGAISVHAIGRRRSLAFTDGLFIGAFTGLVSSIVFVVFEPMNSCSLSHHFYCGHDSQKYSFLEAIMPFMSRLMFDPITIGNILFGSIGGVMELKISKKENKSVMM